MLSELPCLALWGPSQSLPVLCTFLKQLVYLPVLCWAGSCITVGVDATLLISLPGWVVWLLAGLTHMSWDCRPVTHRERLGIQSTVNEHRQGLQTAPGCTHGRTELWGGEQKCLPGFKSQVWILFLQMIYTLDIFLKLSIKWILICHLGGKNNLGKCRIKDLIYIFKRMKYCTWCHSNQVPLSKRIRFQMGGKMKNNYLSYITYIAPWSYKVLLSIGCLFTYLYFHEML